jgi:mannose-6-phosphate isomerase-like protein (cupin superfamily)
MRRERITDDAKGWFAVPWDSDLQVSIGFASEGVDEPHVHSRITEIYIVARGTASIRVERDTVELHEGDALVVEPDEAHTFLSSSDDYLHFVIHTPGLAGDAARSEKQLVPRSRLGSSRRRVRATPSRRLAARVLLRGFGGALLLERLLRRLLRELLRLLLTFHEESLAHAADAG